MKTVRSLLLLGALFVATAVFAGSACADDGITLEPSATFPKLPAEYPLGACSAVALNSQGEIYLFHRGKHPVLCVSPEGQLLRSWGDGLIGSAHGMRVDSQDNVWVTDIGRHRVFKFDPQGKVLLALGTGKPGTGTDEFNQPTDIAFGTNGDFFVSDGYGNSRVLKFAADGRCLKFWGTRGQQPGEFHLPHSLLIDSHGRLLVGDRENNRLQIFNLEGELLGQWAGFAPYGLAMDKTGQVFVADARASQILRLNSEGQVVQRWGQKGKAPGEFDLPHMLAFDSTGDLYIAEVGNKRFQKLTRK